MCARRKRVVHISASSSLAKANDSSRSAGLSLVYQIPRLANLLSIYCVHPISHHSLQRKAQGIRELHPRSEPVSIDARPVTLLTHFTFENARHEIR